MALLAMSNLSSPLFWEVFLGWVLTVAFHEFAHGFVAHLGGDHTIRERGGLTLNPLKYVDPVMTIVLPLFFMLQGGVPLPGGATYVRTDLLRSAAWRSAMSLAGPASNFLVLVFLLLLLHPKLGLFDGGEPIEQWSERHLFVAALALLQAISVVLNLLPIPPLDGYNAIAPLLPPTITRPLRNPMLAYACLIVLFFLVMNSDGFYINTYRGLDALGETMGMGPHISVDLVTAARMALYGKM